jgi:hypothetical protein
VLRFLHGDGCTVADAWRHEHLAQIVRMRATDPCEYAARGGHLEVLRWLHEHDWPVGEAGGWAAANGHMHILVHLKEQEVEFDERTMVDAVHGGDLAVCQFLLSAECPFDAEDVHEAAAECDSIEVIQWVWQLTGTPTAAVLSKMLNAATERNNAVLVEWLQQQGAVMTAGRQRTSTEHYAMHITSTSM